MLVLCYICPPLAVFLMGKPGSAILNMVLTMCLFWVPGISHALVCYADWKATKHVDRVVNAVNEPAYVKRQQLHQQRVANQAANPYVGRKGTVYARRH